jgi:hypothetical protein
MPGLLAPLPKPRMMKVHDVVDRRLLDDFGAYHRHGDRDLLQGLFPLGRHDDDLFELAGALGEGR